MKNIETVPLPPGLYLVATPIGNLRDITLRALDILASADVIACEDTRVTGRLLHAHGIEGRMICYNDHSADAQRGKLLERLAAGARVALASDAGTPLVSDPGYKLVRDCLDLGIPVTSAPGANAPLTALQLSGLPSDKFCFLGFLPAKRQARRDMLAVWKEARATLLMFETGPRLADSLADMRDILGDRPAAVVREMTKMFEESRRGSLGALVDSYIQNGAPKGEIVVAVGAAPERVFGEEEIVALLLQALATMGVKEAAAAVAAQTGLSKKALYEQALVLKDQR